MAELPSINPAVCGNKAVTGLFSAVGKALLIITSASLVAFMISYIWFSFKVSDHAYTIIPDKADGIVVLTGGAGRLETAFKLMDAEKAKRLLISGVHADTSRSAILNAIGRDQNKYNCCIDLDHVALDTTGNAKQTARWANRHGYEKLIIVSSNYHLPRTMIEMQAAMPRVKLVPYQANAKPDDLKTDPGNSVQFKLKEYMKFIAAAARISVFQ